MSDLKDINLLDVDSPHRYYGILAKAAFTKGWSIFSAANLVLAFSAWALAKWRPEWEAKLNDLAWQVPAGMGLLALAFRWLAAPSEVHTETIRQADKRIASLGDDIEGLKVKLRNATLALEQAPTERPFTADDWRKLSADFIALQGSDIRADFHEVQGNEKWELRGGPEDLINCKLYFHLAGRMLLKSPKVAAELSKRVANQSDPMIRWIVFVSERTTGVEQMAHGTSEDEPGKPVVHFFGHLSRLKEKSVAVCMQCAAIET